jgi:Skp family chaperone for outer membrane proteins
VSKLCSALALVVAFSSAAVMAQNGGAPKSSGQVGTVIAVVDINYIMSKHEKAVALRDATQKKDREIMAGLQARAKELEKENEKLRDHKIGSPEYREMQEKLIQRSVELEADRKVGGAQIQEDYAKERLAILMDVQAAIKNFASRNSIDLVLNFDSEKPNIDNPQMLGRYATNLVQHQKDLDITFDILAIVSPNYNKTVTTPSKAAAKTANSGSGNAAPATGRSTKKG